MSRSIAGSLANLGPSGQHRPREIEEQASEALIAAILIEPLLLLLDRASLTRRKKVFWYVQSQPKSASTGS